MGKFKRIKMRLGWGPRLTEDSSAYGSVKKRGWAYLAIALAFLSLTAGLIRYAERPSVQTGPILHNPLIVTSVNMDGKEVITIQNNGDTSLTDVLLVFQPKRELSPGEFDFMEKSMQITGKKTGIVLIRDVTIKPDRVFFEEMKPGDTVSFAVEVIPHGDGNLYGIEVFYGDMNIYGIVSLVEK